MATDKICTIEGCERKVNGRGYCSRHYYYWKFYGDPLAKGPGSGYAQKGKRRKPHKKSIPPRRAPTAEEVGWAAGIFEGEGTMCWKRATVYQNEPWVLVKLQEMFGGVIAGPYPTRHDMAWNISGPYGRAFLKAIWEWLSPRRQAQIKKWDWSRPPWGVDSLP